MKSEALGALRRSVEPLSYVGTRWLTAVPPVKPVGDPDFNAPGESADDVAMRLQIRDLRAMSLTRPPETEQPRPPEDQTRQLLDRPDARNLISTAGRSAERQDEDRPSFTTGFEGTDVSKLTDTRFFAMTQTLRLMSPACQASPEYAQAEASASE